ncbi:MAG TPA: hypothetical protein VEW28_07395 [Candidatus Kapabacteria bacterium]|nr:hypothetical protein [Candidatus Kapabacteria bacterium]
MNRSIIILAVATLLPLKVFAQSADAGISSLENELRDRWRHSIMLTYVYGTSGGAGDSTQQNMKYYSLVLSGEAQIFSGTSVWASLPLNQQDGLLGSVTGIGDLLVIVNQKLFSISGADISLGVGGRFATATVTTDHLPQAYQSGLGSNDLLVDADMISKNINFGIGYQLAGSRNVNNFTQLKRGDEFIVRGGYTYRGDSFDLGGELLAVEPLQQSSVINPVSQSGDFVNVVGSDKLQLSMLLKARYNFNGTFAVTGTLGFPFSERTVNVDGLARSLSASLGAALDL